MDAAQVKDNLSTIVDIQPLNEAQARPLTRLKTPELQRQVWGEAVQSPPEEGITSGGDQEAFGCGVFGSGSHYERDG